MKFKTLHIRHNGQRSRFNAGVTHTVKRTQFTPPDGTFVASLSAIYELGIIVQRSRHISSTFRRKMTIGAKVKCVILTTLETCPSQSTLIIHTPIYNLLSEYTLKAKG